MDEGGYRENIMHMLDYSNTGKSFLQQQWNVMPQYQTNEPLSFHMTTKINKLISERDSAIEERDRALSEKNAALDARDIAVQQRDNAFADWDNARKERDNAIAALQSFTAGSRGLKRTNVQHTLSRDRCITNATPVTIFPYQASSSKNVETKSQPLKKAKKLIGEDLNRQLTTDGSMAEWDAQEFSSMDQIQFDESKMPVPVCSCTGVPHQCYKWSSGGWQSSCCTTSLSSYPLPQMPNKKHARMGGRKMSAGVFSRLLTRLVAAGHDLSTPLDLKNYWAKHGTNRYITIK